mmetsp:Transcript_8162/g.22645  ORF Transcript_8162/g.22645 Transcript_8162/m.22645 type:complete len:572 (-) Transcript_8162:166-1881(-)
MQVSSAYKSNNPSYKRHQFFVEHLQEQYRKLEKFACPIPPSLPKPCSPDIDDSNEIVLDNSNTQRLPVSPKVPPTPIHASAPFTCITRMYESKRKKWRRKDTLGLLGFAVIMGEHELVTWLFETTKCSPTSQVMLDTMKQACLFGNLSMIQSLVRLGCPVDGPLYDDETPLLFAAASCQTDVMEYFLEQHCVDPNVHCGVHVIVNGRPCNGKPVLHHIVNQRGILPAVDILLKYGADPNARCRDGGTALHQAAAGSDNSVVQALIEAGADANAWGGWTKETPLHTAAVWGKTEIVRILLEHGACVNSQNYIKDQPIHVACKDGHIDVIRALVNHGCDIDSRDENELSPLMLAVMQYKNPSLALALLEMGANANCSNETGPILHKAIRTKQYEIVDLMLRKGAIATAAEGDGETPLHALCRDAEAPAYVVPLLANAGADIGATMHIDSSTPLHWAFGHKIVKVADALIEHGADLFIKDSLVRTPMMFAIACCVWDLDDAKGRLAKYLDTIIENQDLSRLDSWLDESSFRLQSTMTMLVMVALQAKNADMVSLIVRKGYCMETPLMKRRFFAL